MLDDAVHEFSRYSDKKFIIQDASLKEVRVAGVFRAGDTEGLLRTLNNNFAIEHEYGAGNTILLYARTTGRAASER
jgi:transmembrane sensor